MCDCLKEIEDKAKVELPKKNKEYEGIEIESSVFTGKFFDLATGKNSIGLPLNISWTHMTKKDREIKKNKEIIVSINYCPFCGESIN